MTLNYKLSMSTYRCLSLTKHIYRIIVMNRGNIIAITVIVIVIKMHEILR